MLSYQVLWFEREGPNFRAPEHYPPLGAACVSTHDLATLAGWWAGTDIDENEALGLYVPDVGVRLSGERVKERRILLGTLARAGLLDESWSERELPETLPTEVAAAIHAWLARAGSALALVQVDDMAGEEERLNLPGTDRERPNWRRRLHLAMDALFETPMARAVLAGLASRRGDGR